MACLKRERQALEPLFRNTVSATMLRGSEQANVIPGEVAVTLDGRLLPGLRAEDLLAELRAVLGADVVLDVVYHDPGPEGVDLDLFPTLAQILRELDPGGVAAPLLLPGSTDARHFAKLGIQTYGFLPMNLPAGFRFTETIHAANERIPLGCLEFGSRALGMLLERFGDR